MVLAEWFLQGYVLHSDLKVLGLQHFYMVIGMDWLEKFSPMKIHRAQKWMTIMYHNVNITLQGLLPGALDCAMVELMQLSTDKEMSKSDETLEVIQIVLQQFQSVFDSPSTFTQEVL
jgi:hypothetical protein